MLKPAAIVGQLILYGAFAAFIGTFATSPKYRQIPDDVALDQAVDQPPRRPRVSQTHA
jgi:hypothetical protein